MDKKQFFKILVLSLVILAGTTVFAKNVIRIGVDGAYPPFSMTSKTGNLKGFDIDIANTLCEKMKAECELIQQDWEGIIPALIDNKFDAIVASIPISEENQETLVFTNHYYKEPARFIRKKGTSDITTVDKLANQSIGVQRGTAADDYITSKFLGDNIEIIRYGTQEESYLDLNAERTDVVFANAFTLFELLNSDEGSTFEFIGKTYSDPLYFNEGIGIALQKTDTRLQQRFNKALTTIRKDGTYEVLRRKYFDFDIYGQ